MVRFFSKYYINKVLDILEKNGFQAFLVGGYVRDYFLNIESYDYDIATDARKEDLEKIFKDIKERKYGSFNLKYKKINIDITTFRCDDIYEDGNLKKIKYTNSVILDANRRDFTMNTIYMDKRGNVLDPFDGQKDLKNRVIVSVGDARKKFLEDPLRILRAIRFSLVYDLRLDKEIEDAIIQTKAGLRNISKIKLKRELDIILKYNGYKLLEKYDLLNDLSLKKGNVLDNTNILVIWAIIDEDLIYPYQKDLKKVIKNIVSILKCDRIDGDVIYKYGYLNCVYSKDYFNLSLRSVASIYKKMPIHRRKDIKIDYHLLKKVCNCLDNEVSLYYKDLEEKILNGNLKNKKKDIIKYLRGR